MKKVVFMGTKANRESLSGQFELAWFNPSKYLSVDSFRRIESVENLWRQKNKAYCQLLDDFLKEFSDFDIVVANWINPFHPEWLAENFPKAIKIYGLIDDPDSSYQRTVASLWAFDGAFYVSPSFDTNISMEDALRSWGISSSYWWPLTVGLRATQEHREAVEHSWGLRTQGAIYVGNLYGPKFDRLAELRASLGRDFSIYGRWQLAGFAGFLGPLKGRRFMPYRVRTISFEERRQLYLSHRIGFNMHLSSSRRETGNMRMYEAPFHGLMLLCDKAADDMHSKIFEPNVEAVFYDSTEDAIEKCQYYLKHDQEREKIARAGFERVMREYTDDYCLKNFLDWASKVPIRIKSGGIVKSGSDLKIAK